MYNILNRGETSGELSLELGEETHTLGEGDAIRFHTDRAHEYRNSGRTLLRLYTVFTWR